MNVIIRLCDAVDVIADNTDIDKLEIVDELVGLCWSEEEASTLKDALYEE